MKWKMSLLQFLSIWRLFSDIHVRKQQKIFPLRNSSKLKSSEPTSPTFFPDPHVFSFPLSGQKAFIPFPVDSNPHLEIIFSQYSPALLNAKNGVCEKLETENFKTDTYGASLLQELCEGFERREQRILQKKVKAIWVCKWRLNVCEVYLELILGNKILYWKKTTVFHR